MIETERLILRQWKESDSEPFIKMGLDEDVMRFFPKLLSATESISLIQRISALIDENGWGFWAVELKETQEFIDKNDISIKNTQRIEVLLDDLNSE
ncbi:GNAT family N-acetyltransferase, partial [Acinetobacter baumannii]